jgi:cation diffusion facilitator family transporter
MINTKRQDILQIVAIGLTVNIILTALKLSFGFWGNAQALVSDGLNSLSDVFISIMLLVVLKLSTKKPDHDHPYGHEKYEGLAYFLLGIIFLITAGMIGFASIHSIIDYVAVPGSAIKPHVLTLVVSILALIIKFGLFKFYLRSGKKFDAPTIKADAKNHLLDAWATLFSVIGLSLAQFNLIIFDYLASIIIAIFILRLALQILSESISYLVDQSPDIDQVQHIHDLILSIDGVLAVDDLKVRKHMTQKYVDVEIGVKSSLTLQTAHRIAELVHHTVEEKFPEVIHCMVHVNPHRP